MEDIIRHYNMLIAEGNDPVHDPDELKAYMDKWDGETFINELEMSENKSVLEIGVGTGRLAVRIAPRCKEFFGIDISPKTVERAKENLKMCENVNLICADFAEYEFDRSYDVIYSSLCFMHIKEKQQAIAKVKNLLIEGGRFVLSIDKNQSEFIDMGSRKIRIYPDDPENIRELMTSVGLSITNVIETEFACIITAIN